MFFEKLKKINTIRKIKKFFFENCFNVKIFKNNIKYKVANKVSNLNQIINNINISFKVKNNSIKIKNKINILGNKILHLTTKEINTLIK